MLAGCRHVDNDELLIEKITLDDNTTVFVYHASQCRICYDRYYEEPKNIGLASKIKIVDLIKRKNEVYDICIDSVHAAALNAISRANMAEMEEHISELSRETWLYWRNVYDGTERNYEVCYSEDRKGKLVPIIDERGYKFAWDLSSRDH